MEDYKEEEKKEKRGEERGEGTEEETCADKACLTGEECQEQARIETLLHRKMSRRQFLKLSAAGVGALALSGFAIRHLFSGSKAAVANETVSYFSRYDSGRNATRTEGKSGLWKWSREADHYITLGDDVQCRICPNLCILQEGDTGFCRSRVNSGGKLYTIAYGNPCSAHVDPVEKKPLLHFLPGSSAFSIAAAGCNFRCKNCQNWQISQSSPKETRNYDMAPENVVQAALGEGCQSIAYTYSEPITYYEYTIDTAKIAREAGLRNILVSNGSINEEPLVELCGYLDAANIDLKSFSDKTYRELCAGRLQPVLDTLKTLKRKKVWFEVTNLVVPQWTDDLEEIREMARWLCKNIGPDYPLHLSRFHPQYQLSHLPATPENTLIKAREIAIGEGLNYVYMGNLGGDWLDTHCPGCGRLLIERDGYRIVKNELQDGNCPQCGKRIAGVWR